MKISAFTRCVGLAAFLLPACLQGSIIVTNFSFETPTLSSGAFVYNPTGVAVGWTFVGDSGIAANSSPFYAPVAPDGVQAAFLQVAPSSTAGAFSQSISGLTIGDNYSITFFAAERSGFPTDVFTVSLGGTSVGSFTPSTTSFVSETGTTIAATATSETLLFQSTSSGTVDSDSAIDKVVITDLGPSAVPEPGTFLLLVPALGGLALFARRRSTKTVA
jgi:hypothetical protein